ncbi:MAG: hypothetical protein UV73_C0009G0026 [Candidatus Gottesmanbacteria bacterium GW2011_GWA2_43_14]|uniref:Uncharacterized protein n=1 Tax=Candidatus Gottesmanbacteria bacterium GW2011_GWA2_43_14 TaxID=1618443 RepID=A0A0G1DFL6_9BACT|nr:MAG: hypothetical protein UV73_C0009G0026 [Candidatus Gottesmanbacteria bacterium GW2011_GWA2_43_14]
MQDAISSAISAALAQNWDLAIEINRNLLKDNKDDLETQCRLAYAYLQTGEFDKARKLYKKILSIDRYHSVAQKNYTKIASMSNGRGKTACSERVSPSLFIEEPGKTKVIQLINLAPFKILSNLSIGDTVQLFPKKHAIEVRGPDKTYYGAMPDDITFRLLRFIDAGNTYLVCIKNIQKNFVSVFIREMSRGKKLKHQSSFSPANLKEFTTTIQKEIKKAVLSEENSDNETQDEPEE